MGRRKRNVFARFFQSLFGFFAGIGRWVTKNFYRLSLVSVILFFGVLLFVFLLDFRVKSVAKTYTITSLDDIDGTVQVGLILGAGVDARGRMSHVLLDRVDTALKIYKQGLVDVLLVSADNSRNEYDEVRPVRDYLMAHGVPASDIFLDYAGFDTYDSLYRAQELFEVQSLIIVTQEFHLPRAVWIARNMGMEAYGFAADRRPYLGRRWYMVREILANVKSFLELSFGIDPYFLGEKVPVTGKSNALLD